MKLRALGTVLLMSLPLQAMPGEAFLSCNYDEMNQLMERFNENAEARFYAYPNAACATFQLLDPSKTKELAAEKIEQYCEQLPVHETCDLSYKLELKERYRSVLYAKQEDDLEINMPTNFGYTDLETGNWEIVELIDNPERVIGIVMGNLIVEAEIQYALSKMGELAKLAVDKPQDKNSLFHIGNLELLHYGSDLLLEKLALMWKSYQKAGLANHQISLSSKLLLKSLFEGPLKGEIKKAKVAISFLDQESISNLERIEAFQFIEKLKVSLDSIRENPYDGEARARVFRTLGELSMLETMNTNPNENFKQPRSFKLLKTLNAYRFYSYSTAIRSLAYLIAETQAIGSKDSSKDERELSLWQQSPNYQRLLKRMKSEIHFASIEVLKLSKKGNTYEK